MAWKKQQDALDLLRGKEARLSELMDESASAVQMVQHTIHGLSFVNQKIERTISEIDTNLHRQNETRSSHDFTPSKNAKGMQNFAKLLCIE